MTIILIAVLSKSVILSCHISTNGQLEGNEEPISHWNLAPLINYEVINGHKVIQ